MKMERNVGILVLLNYIWMCYRKCTESHNSKQSELTSHKFTMKVIKMNPLTERLVREWRIVSVDRRARGVARRLVLIVIIICLF